MRKRELKNMEWSLVIVAVILTIIGLVALFSATQETEYDEFKKQIIWFVVSIVAMILTMLINYETLVKISPVLYVIFLILLVAVILFLTFIISKIQERYKDEINKPVKLLIIWIALAIPLLLIIKQPDYGTAMAFCVAVCMMLFTAGIDKKYIIGAIMVVAISIPILYNFILPEHAKKRIDIFLNPESDPRGSGYNIIQSKLAIGAGGLTGMGLLKGNQTQLGYLYPKTTDFIYSVIGEEMGFIIAGTIIVLYVFLITKALYVAKTAKDTNGSLIASGIAGIFMFHMAENVGMVMGLLPITGVPLLFVSYGGSSLITSYILIGILLNISSKRQCRNYCRGI